MGRVPTPIDTTGLNQEKIAVINGRHRSIGAAIDEMPDLHPDRVGWQYPDENDEWRDLTWKGFRTWIHTTAAGLLEIGVVEFDKVAIVSNTRIEWVIADFALNCLRGITVTIYPNSRPDDHRYILEHSGSRFVVAENEAILATVLEQMDTSQDVRVEQVILLEGTSEDPRVISWSDVQAAGERRLAQDPGCVRTRIDATEPEDLAAIIYTSGTTGRPKGAEITHDNWLYQAAAWHTIGLLGPDDVHFVWLPLSHAFGKCLNLISMSHGTVTAIDGRIDKIVDNLGTVRPTAMCGVPRIFEKVRAAAITKFPANSPKGRLSRWAFTVGQRASDLEMAGKPLPRSLAVQRRIADRLVFSTLRELFGGRLRFFISGSAKLSPAIQRWYHGIGVLLVEGYGVTESCAVTFFSKPWEPQFGTVGRIVPGSTVRIAEDGEVLVRGAGVMRGYHKDPEKTAETIIDGWLHTGDIGTIAADGTLTITDRKKDLIKTSGGKYASPAEIESTLKATCPYLADAVLVGEGRKYLTALLILDPEKLKKWGAKHDLGDDYATLSQRPEIRRSIEGYVEQSNAKLGKWETIKKFAILDRELTVESGEMTPTSKVRRNIVLEEFADVVESLYPAE